jgi:UDP-GlcNAc:undecaprenyl-phosphate GlcNAc-1-phosphate transferase
LTTAVILAMHLGSVLLGFGLTVALIPWIIRASVRVGLLDQPDNDRRVHTVAVPRLGGVGIFVATATAAAFLIAWSLSMGAELPYPRLLPGVVLGATLIFFTGLFDDLKGVSPSSKLIAQTLAALCVVAYGFKIDAIALSPSSAALDLGLLAIPVTVLWIVGMTNAFNLIDGVDGLAGTIALIALTVSIGVDLFVHDIRSLYITTAMLGAVFGFLRFNNSPAKIFLGDSGSMTLGFFLAIRLVISSTETRTGSVGTVTYALVPIFGLAFPLLDTFIAMARRWLRGHPFSRADGRHVHHQLLALGLSARQTVDILGLFFACVAALGISIVFAPPRLTIAFMLGAGALMFASVFYGTRWLKYGEFSELGASIASVFRNARLVVREKIRANEIAEQIRAAESLEEVQEILQTLVDDVRVLDVELVAGNVHFHGPERQQISPVDQLPIRLDYPFAWETEGGVREVILRLWSIRPQRGVHPATERVATRIGPALEEWFQRNSREATPVFGIEAQPQSRKTPSAMRRVDG